MTKLFFTLVLVFWGAQLLGGDTSFGFRPCGRSTQRPRIVCVTIKQHPLIVRDDYLDVPPWYHVFGEDSSIQVYQWKYGERPNPFSLSPGTIYLVNLVPDTLVIELCNEEGLTQETIYEGYIDRGDFSIRVVFDQFVPSGIYYFNLAVGDENQEEKMIYLK